MLIQEFVSKIKKRRVERAEARRKAARMHVEVHGRDVLWAQDGTHLMRVKKEKIEAQVIRDVASCRDAELAVGPPADANDVVALLDRCARERGGPPLVWSTDNGSPYRSERAERWLERHRVIHLRNVPHTPRHNAYAERAIGELKQRCGIAGHQLNLDAFAEISDPVEATEYWTRELGQARLALDRHTPRESRGGWTAEELDGALERGDTLVSRARFYRRARRAIANATANCGNGRARRRAEREAIYATLETFGLIGRARGNSPFHAGICEGVS
jgi:transposase InsO family protein